MTAITTWEETKVHWEMLNRTHTDERKMMQLYYLVLALPGCVISMSKFIFLKWSTLVWSAE